MVSLWYPLDKRPGGPQSRSGRGKYIQDNVGPIHTKTYKSKRRKSERVFILYGLAHGTM